MAETPISRVGALKAAAAGGEAFRAGQALTDCPHGRDDLGDDFMAHHWNKGFIAASQA